VSLAQRPIRVLDDRVDRRVLGAIRFVDATTRQPVTAIAKVEARFAMFPGIPVPVPVPDRSIQIRQNRRGWFVIFRAPFFDAYIATFDSPQPPAELGGAQLGLRVDVSDAGPYYLPRQFQVDLPRSLDPAADGNVFDPLDVRLFRAPSSPLLDGWAVVRVSIARTGAGPRQGLGGVLVRAFVPQHAADAQPLGVGMTDWRRTVAGEAVVPIVIPRFRAGDGNGGGVIQTTQDIELEVTRDPQFPRTADDLPDLATLEAGGHPRFVVPGAAETTLVRPDVPLQIRAGRELSVVLTMP
jgi:hypothetical protein